jgi:hypothetical protein
MAGGRKAGDDATYEWALIDKSTGKVNRAITLEFPSVTTIIGRILAKPQLMAWLGREGTELLSSAMSVIGNGSMDRKPEDILFLPDEDGFSMWDYLCDADTALEWLKDNGITSKESMKLASERGKKAHSFFESVSDAYIDGEHDDGAGEGSARATEMLARHRVGTPYEQAIKDWWTASNPKVVESETVLVSKRHDFMGTCDLIWLDQGVLTVTDLKTRRAGLGSYDSDHIQTGAYAIAYEEMTGLRIARRTILLAQDDGTYREDESWVDPSVFLNLRAVYRALEERR